MDLNSIVLFGASSVGAKAYDFYIQIYDEIIFIDNDINKQQSFFTGAQYFH